MCGICIYMTAKEECLLEMISPNSTMEVTSNTSECMNGCGPYCPHLNDCYPHNLCSVCWTDIHVCLVACLCIING